MRKILCLITLIFGLAGCAPEEQGPVVVYVYGAAPAPRPPTPSPGIMQPSPPSTPAPGMVPSSWLPSRRERAWSAIIIHHSATNEGNAAIFDKWHREENGWAGVGYHFVIGNGTDSGDGEVEPTYRWRGQLTGAHTGGTAANWANEEGIGICLVGDFNRYTPTASQRESLVRLVRFLQQRYHIPKTRIYGHGSTPGARVTDCPGNRFPMSWLKSVLPD
jgi:N-acetylmuramoyl-L-alanine amidase